MSRSCLVLGILVAASGCGVTALAPSGGAALDDRAAASVSGAPVTDAVARSMASAMGRRNRVAGYYWIGYTPADFGTGDLRELGSGTGFSFGMGLTFAEAGRAFLEVAFEKTVDHDYLGSLTNQTGHHERFLVGGRIAATAMARMEKQPRPYMSYGVCNNKYRVDGIGARYEATGIGLYAGLGVEFPFAQKSSLSFDTRYHAWSDTDTNGLDGKFASVAMSLLWLGRF